MELLTILAADYANIAEGGKLNVMGIFRTISAPTFPARHSSMFLVIKLRPEIGEYEEDRKLIVLLHDEDGGEMARITGNLHVPAPKGGQIPEINAVLELKDIVFPKPGHYRFVVLVDKDHKGNLPIDLIEFVREEE